MKRSTFSTIMISLAVILIAYARFASRPDGSAARRELAAIEIRTLFTDLPLPPDAKPGTTRQQKTLELRGRFAIEVEQVFERPGAFAATDAFYARELPARGWREYDRSTVDRKYCQAPYLLAIEQDAVFADRHRFALRLMYDDRKRGKWKCE